MDRHPLPDRTGELRHRPDLAVDGDPLLGEGAAQAEAEVEHGIGDGHPGLERVRN